MPRALKGERLENALLAFRIEDVRFALFEVDGNRIAEFDFVGQRNLRDEVDASEVAVDVILVAKKFGDGNLQLVIAFLGGFVNILRPDAIDNRVSR